MVTSFTDASFDLLGFNVQSLAHCDAVGEGGIHSITYAKWLNGIGAKFVLLRPDFYVAATAATAEELRHRFDEVMSRLHVQAAVAA